MKRPKRSPGKYPRALTLEQLEEWLEGLKPQGPGVSQIDGFLAALIVSPQIVDPEKWLWHIMGDRAKSALEGSIAAAATATIIDRYNAISFALSEDPKSYAPIYMRTDDGEVLLEEWANGFYGGMRLALSAWRPFITDPDVAIPLTAILGHCTTMTSSNQSAQTIDDKASAVLADSWRVVPEVVSMLYDKCAAARNASTA